MVDTSCMVLGFDILADSSHMLLSLYSNYLLPVLTFLLLLRLFVHGLLGTLPIHLGKFATT